MSFKLRSDDGNWVYALDARSEFLRAVERHAPVALKALATDVFDAYAAFILSSRRRSVALDAADERGPRAEVDYEAITELREFDEPAGKLYQVLTKWGEDHRLGPDYWESLPNSNAWQTPSTWVLDTALHTCSVLHRDGRDDQREPPHRFHLPPGAWSPVRDEDLRVTVFIETHILGTPIEVVTHWDPGVEKRKGFEKRFLGILTQVPRKHARRQLVGQLDAIASLYEERAGGFGQAADKRELENHLSWLVQYQVHGWTQNTIMLKHFHKVSTPDNVSEIVETTVGRAIKDLSEILGLKLRTPSTGGRPRSP